MSSIEEQKHLDNVARGLKAATHNPNVSAEAKANAAGRLAEMGIESDISPAGVTDATETSKHDNHVLGGYKATLKNDNVSEQAKEHAREVLENAGTQYQDSNASQTVETNRSLGGYKATLHNDRTSDAAKEHAKEILEAAGYTVEQPATSTTEQHQANVLAGYKAAVNNPRVSEQAKQHAREYLAQHGTSA